MERCVEEQVGPDPDLDSDDVGMLRRRRGVCRGPGAIEESPEKEAVDPGPERRCPGLPMPLSGRTPALGYPVLGRPGPMPRAGVSLPGLPPGSHFVPDEDAPRIPNRARYARRPSTSGSRRMNPRCPSGRTR